jgi:hypothetical protein
MSSPEIKHCLICEDVRLERRNLISLMGVYGVTPFVGIRVLNFQAVVAFFVLFVGPPTQGKYAVQLQLRDAKGQPVQAEIFPERNELTFSLEMGSTVFAFRIRATFPAPSTYSVALSNNEIEFFSDTFQVAQGTPQDFN